MSNWNKLLLPANSTCIIDLVKLNQHYMGKDTISEESSFFLCSYSGEEIIDFLMSSIPENIFNWKFANKSSPLFEQGSDGDFLPFGKSTCKGKDQSQTQEYFHLEGWLMTGLGWTSS